MLVSIFKYGNKAARRIVCQWLTVLLCLTFISCSNSTDTISTQDQFFDDDPSTEFQVLSELLGEVTFDFSLTDSMTVFTLSAGFSEVQVSALGRDQIVALGRLSSRTGEDQEPVDNGDRSVDCVFVAVDSLYLCSVSFVDDAAGFFAFPPLVEGSSTGTFEFCLSNNRLGSCFDELVNAPDGNVTVSLQLVETPSLVDAGNTVFVDIRDGFIDNSAEMLLVYEKQSSSTVNNP